MEVDLMADRVLAIGLSGWNGPDGAADAAAMVRPSRRTPRPVGEIRVTTGPSFPGAHLDVSTPVAAIEVSGTTFAVILEPHGTCVCVLEGTVKVGRRDTHKMGDVPRPAPLRLQGRAGARLR